MAPVHKSLIYFFGLWGFATLVSLALYGELIGVFFSFCVSVVATVLFYREQRAAEKNKPE